MPAASTKGRRGCRKVNASLTSFTTRAASAIARSPPRRLTQHSPAGIHLFDIHQHPQQQAQVGEAARLAARVSSFSAPPSKKANIARGRVRRARRMFGVLFATW